MPIVFRIHGPHGRTRVEVSNDCTLNDLYKIVANHCNIENPALLTLYTELHFKKHVRHSTSVKVGSRESGLSDGQILYAKVEEQRSDSAAAKKPHSGVNNSNSSFSSNITKSSAPIQSSLSPPTEPNKVSVSTSSTDAEVLKPKFKSFDQFLKDRGFNVVDLSLNQSYKSKFLERGKPNIIPPTVTLKHQPYRHVDHVEYMNVQEMTQFVHYWRHTLDMQEQRAGWLFGYFVEDKHYQMGIRAVIEAIYEPPQVFQNGEISLLEDPFFSNVKEVAASLKLELLGWIFTHLPREALLTSTEVKRIAKLQLDHVSENTHYTGYPVSPFVTVTVSLDPESNGEPTTNAYMISDLGMAFQRDGILDDSPDPYKMQLKKTVQNEILPDILESGKSTNMFDPDWLIVRVNDSAPKEARSLFQSWSFPVENRQKPIRPADVPTHLRSTSAHSSLSSLFADWHLLLYIAFLFDVATASAVCENIMQKQPIDSALVETLKLL